MWRDSGDCEDIVSAGTLSGHQIGAESGIVSVSAP